MITAAGLVVGGVGIWAGCFWLRDHWSVTRAGLWWFSLGGTLLILVGATKLIAGAP